MSEWVDADLLCQNCGHGEERHQGGAWCIEDDCKEFAYPDNEEVSS